MKAEKMIVEIEKTRNERQKIRLRAYEDRLRKVHKNLFSKKEGK